MTDEGQKLALQGRNALAVAEERAKNVKPGMEKATWLPGPDGQQHPFELKDGKYIPIETPEGVGAPVDPKAEYQKAALDLRQKTLELQQAKFKAAQDPNNPTTKAALIRAQQEATRSQAYMIRAQAQVSGTDMKGNPLPGAVLDAQGNPVGGMFQGNVKPTGQEIGRADLAASALEQMDTMKDILTNRSDLFGPAAGHITDFRKWIGTQDPDAQRFTAAARVAADHLAGVFGGRSQAALQHIYDVIGKNITNPNAAIAALDQMALAAAKIKERGTRHTVGGVPQNPEGPGTKELKGMKGKGGKLTAADLEKALEGR